MIINKFIVLKVTADSAVSCLSSICRHVEGVSLNEVIYEAENSKHGEN